MRLPSSRLGWLATAPYFGLLFAAAGYLVYRVEVAPVASDLAARALVVLAFPWSIVGISLGDSVGLWIGFISGLVLNAALCYHLGRAVERRWSKLKTEGSASITEDRGLGPSRTSRPVLEASRGG